jgi:hypothetical protein
VNIINIPHAIVRELVFLLFWVTVNALAFWLGWVTGGNDSNATPFQRIFHNAYYGFFIGLAQLLVMSVFGMLPKSGSPTRQLTKWLWPVFTSLGFACGVNAAYSITRLVGFPHSLFNGFLFGVLIGGCVTLAQSVTLMMQGLRALTTLSWWYLGSSIGWLSGEIMDSVLGYGGILIPLTGVLIGVGSGIGLLKSIRTHYSARRIRAISVW